MSTSKPRRIITRTPEQQQRKRVQDREAQRVSRERTKALIGELEQQVRQLQADHSQCHEQLQACARERNDALAEADEARKRAQVAEHKLSLLRGRLTSTLNLISEDDDSARSSATQASSSRDALGTPSLDLTRQVSTTETSQVPVWSLDTRTIEATCPLDSILLKLLHSRRELVRGGESEDVAAGPIAPSFAALLGFRSLRSAHETCQIFTNIITTMEAVHRLPEQVAVIWIMYKLMRVSCGLQLNRQVLFLRVCSFLVLTISGSGKSSPLLRTTAFFQVGFSHFLYSIAYPIQPGWTTFRFQRFEKPSFVITKTMTRTTSFCPMHVVSQSIGHGMEWRLCLFVTTTRKW